MCTILLIVCVLTYLAYKLQSAMSRTEYQLIQETEENKFAASFQWSNKDGFAAAAAVTNFDASGEDIEDPTIGTIKFVIKSWSPDYSGIRFKELKQRPCTEADFDGRGDFWPLQSKFLGYKVYYPKVKCIDEPYHITGYYDADAAENLMVVFDRCNPEERSDCKGEEEY